MGRDVFPVEVQRPDLHIVREPPPVDMKDIILAFADVMKRASMYESHHVHMEPLSVRERMSRVLALVQADHFTDFSELFTVEEGRSGVVVSLLAILELIKQSLIELVQTEAYGPIHVKSIGSVQTES